MDREIQRLVLDFAELGRTITQDDVPDLVKGLSNRIGIDEGVLDYSSESLKKIEKALFEYHEYIESNPISDKDMVLLIRQIAAYTGQTILVQCNGRWWDKGLSLWASSILIDKPVKTYKGPEIRKSKRRGYPATKNAAYFWDNIRNEKIAGYFHREYEAMNKNVWVEGVTKRWMKKKSR